MKQSLGSRTVMGGCVNNESGIKETPYVVPQPIGEGGGNKAFINAIHCAQGGHQILVVGILKRQFLFLMVDRTRKHAIDIPLGICHIPPPTGTVEAVSSRPDTQIGGAIPITAIVDGPMPRKGEVGNLILLKAV